MAGRPLDRDQPVCIMSCLGVEAEPKMSRLFLWIFVPDPRLLQPILYVYRVVGSASSGTPALGSVVFSRTVGESLRPLTTLVSNPYVIHLATGLLVNLNACRLHFQACLYHFQACPYHFQACPYHVQACRDRKPAFLLQLSTTHLQSISSMT